MREVLAKAPAEAIRLVLLRTHYRAELDFTEAGLAEAKRELDRFYRALERFPEQPAGGASGGTVPAAVLDALCDDLNTPLAISAMHGLADAALAGDRGAASGLHAAGNVLGLLQQAPDAWFRGGEADDAAEIETAIAERLAARQAKNFTRADAIRAELAAKGILLEDGPKGTTWRRIG